MVGLGCLPLRSEICLTRDGWSTMSRLKLVAALAGIAAIALVLPACFGDPEPPPGVQIENRTDLQLKVFSLTSDGTRLLVAEVSPHESSEAAGGPCVRDFQLVAETPDGTIIARRGPFDECNKEPWIIEVGSS
jgi:hypothetical protein